MTRAGSARVQAAEIVRDAGGQIVGRTKFQKIAYLLELAGFGAGFSFEYRHYGPYSEELADAIQVAEAFGLIIEEERQADWGGFYSIFTATPRAGKAAAGPRTVFAQRAAQMGAVELELAATAAYLSSVEQCEDPWEETARRKPEKARYLPAAKRAYRQLMELHLTDQLPAIA